MTNAELCNIISNAKCCSAKLAAEYVEKVTYGEDSAQIRYEWLELNTYIKTLERYDAEPTKTVYEGTELNNGDQALYNDGKRLYFDLCPKVIELCPCAVNCIKKDELCSIIEKINLRCGNCGCDC